jgi:hypothetical protein
LEVKKIVIALAISSDHSQLNKTSEANASEVLFAFYLFPIPTLRIPPLRPIFAVFDGHAEFFQLVADLVGERP